MRKIVWCVLFLCLLLAGCAPTDPAVPDEPLSGQEKELVLAENGATDFLLVISDDAADTIRDSLPKFSKQLKKQTSSDFKMDTDWTARGEEVDNSRLEILIGNTNRAATQDLLSVLPDHSYGIRVTEDKVVIVGTNDSLTALALYEFENTFFFGTESYLTDGKFALPVGTEIIKTNEKWDDVHYILASSIPSTITIGQVTRIQMPKDMKAAEGFATDGTYFYTAFIRGTEDGDEGRVVKSLPDGTHVATSEILPIDHANDMCYNPDDNVLVITNMNRPLLTVVDPDTLEIVKTVDCSTNGIGGSHAIGYNPAEQMYVLRGEGAFKYLDRDFNLVEKVVPGAYTTDVYGAQGMDADDAYIFSVFSAGPNVDNNLFRVYTWKGTFLRDMYIPTKVEGETSTNYNGKFYMTANDWSTYIHGQIYELQFSFIYK